MSGNSHILHVVLWDDPDISRDIEVESSQSLYHLAEAITAAFGFHFDHAFGFYSDLPDANFMQGQPRYELFADMGESEGALSVKNTRIAEAFPDVGHMLTFVFDYGDEWLFRVEMIGSAEKDANAHYPRVLARRGEAPPQYPEQEDER